MLLWNTAHGPEPELLDRFEANLQVSLPDQWLVEDCPDPERLQRLLSILEDQTSPVLLLPRWLKGGHYRPEFFQLGSIAALQLWGGRGTPMELKLKRGMDLLASGILLVLLAPLLMLIAVAIRLDSAGPVLFRQRRYGLGGESFDCLKFRTMRVQENGEVVEQARQHDPRVTRLGRWLRSWNLDELPQLLNVWRGEMSLVGPRPHAAAHNEYYRTRVRGYMRRHALRPGLTGWAQVMGLRGRTETIDRMEARVSADLNYIQNWSLRLDLKILLLTLFRWRNEHAY
jgi:putative colanic acid biosynthesis UDP-glucose lipid carrier transferase